jgi:hypothetical protein
MGSRQAVRNVHGIELWQKRRATRASTQRRAVPCEEPARPGKSRAKKPSVRMGSRQAVRNVHGIELLAKTARRERLDTEALNVSTALSAA